MHQLQMTPDEVRSETEGLYDRMRRVVPEIEWAVHAPLVAEINRLKRQRNAVILAHMMRVANLILKAAETRTESRGAHFRADVPWSSPCWQQDLVFEGDRLVPPHVVQPAAAVG